MEENTYSDGSQYFGEYKDGLRHGQGTFTYSNGDKYVGEWKDNTRNGWGTYTYKSHDQYEGEYKDGLRHGQGTVYTEGGQIPQQQIIDLPLKQLVAGSWREGEFLYETMRGEYKK